MRQKDLLDLAMVNILKSSMNDLWKSLCRVKNKDLYFIIWIWIAKIARPTVFFAYLDHLRQKEKVANITNIQHFLL